MDRDAKLKDAFKDFMPDAPVQVRPATVVSVSGRTCTVDIVGTDLTGIEGVNLVADEEASNGLLLTPKVGSLVFVASLENSLDTLFVCSFGEIDTLDCTIGKTTLHLEAQRAVVRYDKAHLTLEENMVAIANDKTDLKALYADMIDILKTFKVVCASPGAPSASVFPDTLTKIVALETKYKQLLK